jgi:DNA-binding response OmpR family regulator
MAKVMFVDDDVDSLEMFKKCVEIFGHQAVTACNPAEALAHAQSCDLDVVFVDLYLANASGLEVVSALRRQVKTAQTPVYLLSAGSEYELDKTIEHSGADAYLQKPVHLQNLLATISHAMSRPAQSISLRATH